MSETFFFLRRLKRKRTSIYIHKTIIIIINNYEITLQMCIIISNRLTDHLCTNVLCGLLTYMKCSEKKNKNKKLNKM